MCVFIFLCNVSHENINFLIIVTILNNIKSELNTIKKLWKIT